MNKILKWCACMLMGSLLYSCALDNYDEPEAHLTGRLVYNGEAIPVSVNDVYFQLWEPGWENNVPIRVAVDQDGSFSALLFDANYKLVIPSGQGPFVTEQDTLEISVSGNEQMDIEVLPYFMIRNANINGNAEEVNASFGVEQIITGDDARSIERVSLYLNKTAFVGPAGTTNIAVVDLGGDAIADQSAINLTVGIPEIVPEQNYVFARVGLKIAGVEDMIFTEIQKIEF